jgi:hypothetical protein
MNLGLGYRSKSHLIVRSYDNHKASRIICSKFSSNILLIQLTSDEGHNDKNRSIMIDIIGGFICLVLLFPAK